MGLPVGAGKEPLSKFFERWLEDTVKARSRPRTFRLYKQQVEGHIIPVGSTPRCCLNGDVTAGGNSKLETKTLVPIFTARCGQLSIRAPLERPIPASWQPYC